MSARESLKLLILSSSRNDGEAMVAAFRNAGRATRAHVVLEAESLSEELASQAWDFAILDVRPDQLDELLPSLRDHLPLLPTVLLGDPADGELISHCLRSGLRDVVPKTDLYRLVLVAEREATALNHLRQCIALQDALIETRERCEQVLNDTRDAVAYIADGMHVYANPVYAQQFGFADPSELECVPVVDLIHPSDQAALKKLLVSIQQGDTDQGQLTLQATTSQGESHTIEVALERSQYDGEACVQIMLLNDREMSPALEVSPSPSVSAPPPAAAQQHPACLPVVSALENFIGRLNTGLLAGAGGGLLAVLPDNLGELQQKAGLRGSAQLLSAIAHFAQEQLGDATEMAITQGLVLLWQPECAASKAHTLAEQLAHAIAEHSFDTEHQSLHCTVSIGVCGLSGDQGGADTILDDVLRAALKRQQQGGNGALGAQVRKVASSTGQVLENALEEGRFRLLFQPIISLRSAGGEFYEVVLRYTSEDGQEQTPDNFIRNHCQGGNTRLDRWLIMEATKRLAQHRQAGHDTTLIINLSSNAMQDEGLLDWLTVAVRASGVPQSSLIFQFAEEDVSQFSKMAKTISQALQHAGFRVSLCDFGCSPDPFRSLKQLSVDMVKVDGSFTRAIQQNSSDTQALRALIQGLREEGKHAIVPFVENAAVLATLWQVGPNYIQGHYLAAPLADMTYEFTELA